MKTTIAAFIDRMLSHIGFRLVMVGKGLVDYRVRRALAVVAVTLSAAALYR